MAEGLIKIPKSLFENSISVIELPLSNILTKIPMGSLKGIIIKFLSYKSQ